MLTGKKFRLNRETIAIETIREVRGVVMVPSGEIVTVLHGPTADDKRMVDVRWNDRTLVMFAVDVNVRGTEVLEDSASA
jgi:hypothetical protein